MNEQEIYTAQKMGFLLSLDVTYQFIVEELRFCYQLFIFTKKTFCPCVYPCYFTLVCTAFIVMVSTDNLITNVILMIVFFVIIIIISAVVMIILLLSLLLLSSTMIHTLV